MRKSAKATETKSRGDLNAQVQSALSELVLLGVTIPRPSEVKDNLLRYPDLIDLLLPVSVTTRQRFGPEAQLSLEVYRDPEVQDSYLALYVRQDRYDDTVMERITQICAGYEQELADRSGWFLVTTDFCPPR
jgi:hypothetical protein